MFYAATFNQGISRLQQNLKPKT